MFGICVHDQASRASNPPGLRSRLQVRTPRAASPSSKSTEAVAMSDSRSTASIWCAVVLGAYLGIAPDLQGGTVTFRSNNQWSVLSSSNVPVGNAEYVALNA